MRLALIVAATVLAAAPLSAAAEAAPDHVWMTGSLGVGAGADGMGAMNAVAKLDAYLWLRDGFGVVAVAIAPSTDASVVAAGVAYRLDLDKVGGVPHYLHVGALIGRDRDEGLAGMARIGMHRRRGLVLFSVDLVAYGSLDVGPTWLTTVGLGIAL